MRTRNELSRITIEIPKAHHKKLKAQAAILGKSMRDIILEALEIHEACLYSSHEPNAITIQSLKNIKDGKHLTSIESIEELAKQFGL